MVSEWPRLGIFLISVTLGLRFCRLYEALAIAQGTVWSFSPSRISSGPRSGFFVSTFDSVQGLRLELAIWARASVSSWRGRPGPPAPLRPFRDRLANPA